MNKPLFAGTMEDYEKLKAEETNMPQLPFEIGNIIYEKVNINSNWKIDDIYYRIISLRTGDGYYIPVKRITEDFKLDEYHEFNS